MFVKENPDRKKKNEKPAFFLGEPRRVFHFQPFSGLSFMTIFECFHLSPFPGVFIFHLSLLLSYFTLLGCFHFSSFSGVAFLTFFGSFSVAVRRVLRIGESFFTLRPFLPYTPSRHFAQQSAFIMTSLGACSSSFKVVGPPNEVRNADPAHLFV